MSITRSYNKHTDTYYAYETTYVWDDNLKKRVQHKRCIGRFDPETNEIIPNGKRGRPRHATQTCDNHDDETPVVQEAYSSELSADKLEEISRKLDSVEQIYRALENELRNLGTAISELKSQTIR